MGFTPRNMRYSKNWAPIDVREEKLRAKMEKIEERISFWMNARVDAEEEMAELLRLKERLAASPGESPRGEGG